MLALGRDPNPLWLMVRSTGRAEEISVPDVKLPEAAITLYR